MTTVGVVVHEGKSLGGGPDELRRRLADAGHPHASWAFVPKSKKAPAAVRKLVDDGVDRLIVWGGDGTVRRCIDTLVADDAAAEVAIMPAGTANHLARALGVPGDLAGAADVALAGVPRAIDIGVVNGEAFAVMAGSGFDALMIRDVADGSKARFGRLSYVRAATRHLTSAGAGMRIEVDGDAWFTGRAACVLVGNVGRIIGGIDVFPEARLDDGVLEVGVVTAARRRDWARVAARAIAGRIDASPFVETTSAASLRIELDRRMPWELDGGDRAPARKFELSVLPRRIPVMVPAP
ncbi:diacylglycerol/lipid kinase family protein [Desertimonas flava]|uniref:diacylglycerol/lipid kinase family protein n=1 Tax=Desertimonas flava TaxID=2064846 RepID=UPI00196940B7|nr:YegS/Rv2252/BmrU family lipid kinase [Desertimonas flava]